MRGRLLGVLMVVPPLVEIALFVLVGQAIGVLSTLGLVILSSIFGMAIIRQRGLALMSSIRTTVGQRTLPALEIADTMLVWVAGALLIVPGFFTSAVGLILLVPPVRMLIYGLLARRFKVVTTATTTGTASYSETAQRTIELDPDQFRSP